MPSPAPVVTRFAPSPTGYLHIGGARTALFNWLYARHTGGRFLLRIEDTDRARSTPEATAAIFEGLRWLGLDWDGERDQPVRAAPSGTPRSRATMLARGTAYRCYATPEEIEAFREAARAEGRPPLFRSPWRDADPATAPDAPYVVRLKAPREGETVVDDRVQGTVTWKNETLDDLILLRSDGTPTYMLAVVVDDHDMGVTHVIRGDDHLTNAARQTLIYRGDGLGRAGLRPHPADPRPRRRQALQAARRARDRGLPRHGLPAGGDAQLPRPARLEPRQRRVLHHRAGDRLVRPRRTSARRRPGSTSASSRPSSGQHIRAADDAAAAGRGRGLSCSAKAAALDRTRSARRCCGRCPGSRSARRPFRNSLRWRDFILGERPFLPDAAAAKVLASVSHGMLARFDFATAKC